MKRRDVADRSGVVADIEVVVATAGGHDGTTIGFNVGTTCK